MTNTNFLAKITYTLIAILMKSKNIEFIGAIPKTKYTKKLLLVVKFDNELYNIEINKYRENFNPFTERIEESQED